MTYLTTPRYGGHANSIKILQSLILQARRGNRSPHAVRVVVDGDSRSATPGGFGYNTIPLLAYEFYKVFGNMPASQILPIASAGNGANPVGASSTGAASGTNAVGDTLQTRYPYNTDPVNAARRAGDGLGFLVNLNHRLDFVSSEATEIERTSTEYIKRLGVRWNAMIPHVSTQGDNLEVSFLKNASATTNYYDPDSTLGPAQVINISAAKTANNLWLNLNGLLNWGAKVPTAGNLGTVYGQAQFRSASSSQMVEVGPVWFTSSDTRGFEFHTFSQGGKKMADQLLDRPNQAPFCTAFDPDIWYIALGTNDAGNGVSSAQFQADAQAKITARLASNPNALCVLIADYDRGSPTNGPDFDLYADVLYSLSLISSNRSVFINRRRLTEEATGGLWNRNSGSFTTYCPDSVHAGILGSRIAAKADASALLAMGSTAVISGPSLGIQIG
ncbi:MAG: SGNH/GDSL hydrolase family protein [Phycisphaerales bacterium]|nr:SGNH/GDSL hydrolase family protein [Phycisphaerales bacterium]